MNAALNTMLAVAGFISTAGLALTYVYKAFRQISAPQRVQDDKIRLHEEWLKRHDKVLERHSEELDENKRRMQTIEESNRMIQRSLFALMGHALDENDTEALRRAKDALEEHLIEK